MPSEDPERQRRLAEALRANLRRRKGQTRERDQAENDPPVGPDPDGPGLGATIRPDLLSRD